jgi:hypothetical protein
VGRLLSYEPFALDYCEAAKALPSVFEAAGAPKLTLFHEDFLQWSTSERFELVYSFGFIEHFNDWPGMIRLTRSSSRKAGTCS